MRKLYFLIFSILVMSAPQGRAEITWKEGYYNPAPDPADLILPMPCGGAMTFRLIETPNTDGVLGDYPITLGQEDDTQPYLNGLRGSFVSGAFTNDAKSNGYFYLAKYELARAQYDAVMAPCPDRAPRKRAFVPATELSKLSLEQFAETYSLWLLNNASDALPRAGDTQGYIRLPTEEEWEFAARGGLAVEEVLFRAPHPPLPDGREISEFVAHGGANSAGGKVQVIGSLQPNPLGLHDMLGNVSEIVGTPFALVRNGRLHGQTGGFVKRGGDARTPLESITSATRYEVSPIDFLSNAPTQDRYTGTRLAIGGLSITSHEQTGAMLEALAAFSALDKNLADVTGGQEVLTTIGDIRKNLRSTAETDQENARLQEQLAVLQADIERERDVRNQLRNKSIRIILTNGTLFCNQAVEHYLDALAMGVLMQRYDEIEAEAIASGDGALLQDVRQARIEDTALTEQEFFEAGADVLTYGNTLEGLANDYSKELLLAQLGNIRSDIEGQGIREKRCLSALGTHLATRQAAGFLDLGLVEEDFQGIAQELAR